MVGKEIGRILSRKITLLALAVATAFSVFYGCLSIGDEMVIDNGEVYRYGEAVALDKKIAEEFAGPLTEGTVRAIWEKYGEPVNYLEGYGDTDILRKLAASGGYDNFCNSLVARLFGEQEVQGNGTVVLALSEEKLAQGYYLDGSYMFGYVGQGWNWYWDHYLIVLVMVCLVLIIGFSPVFSEDYAFRTADILLPTVKGRFYVWRMRIGGGFLFASVYYWLLSGISFLQTYLFYGPEGLSVSCGLTCVPYYFQKNAAPVWEALLVMHLGGWFSLLVLVLLIQAISSRCKSSFMSLLWTLAAYLGPIAVIRMVLDNLPVNRLIMWVKYYGYSMPFSFSGMYMQAPPQAKQVLVVFALATAMLAGTLGALGWCRHQVRN